MHIQDSIKNKKHRINTDESMQNMKKYNEDEINNKNIRLDNQKSYKELLDIQAHVNISNYINYRV